MATKKLPKLGATNTRNIDGLVAAGLLTPKEGERAKTRFKRAEQKKPTTKK